MKARAFAVIGVAFLPLLTGCHKWQDDAIVDGIAFERVKIDRQGRAITGILPEDTNIAGAPCHRGYVHLHPNGVPASFEAAEEIVLPDVTIPAGTWVRQNSARQIIVCAFPQDYEVQGYLCRGTGGPKGVQVSFYPSGKLRQFFLVNPTVIDGFPCDVGLVRGWVELHENGRLRSARLSEEHRQGERLYRRGTRVLLDPHGHPIEADPMIWIDR